MTLKVLSENKNFLLLRLVSNYRRNCSCPYVARHVPFFFTLENKFVEKISNLMYITYHTNQEWTMPSVILIHAYVQRHCNECAFIILNLFVSYWLCTVCSNTLPVETPVFGWHEPLIIFNTCFTCACVIPCNFKRELYLFL